MTNLTTNRNHMTASRLYALAADARRSALKDDADRALAAIHADQARRMRARAVAARNGTPYIGATDMTNLTTDGAPYIGATDMTNLTTNRNHFAAARFYALAADARRAALNECVDWIERGILPPVYCRIDTAAARYYADQARSLRARAIQSRYMRGL